MLILSNSFRQTSKKSWHSFLTNEHPMSGVLDSKQARWPSTPLAGLAGTLASQASGQRFSVFSLQFSVQTQHSPDGALPPAAGSVDAEIGKNSGRLITQSYSPTTQGRVGLAEEIMNIQ